MGGDYPTLKVILAETLVLANVTITADLAESTIAICEVLVAYNKEHLLQNRDIGPPTTRLVVMSGGEALDWAVDQVRTRARLRQERGRGGIIDHERRARSVQGKEKNKQAAPEARPVLSPV